MKTLACLLLSALCLCSNALADTVQIGKTSFSYHDPEGFARADDLFHIDAEALDKRFLTNTVIFAKYVPQADATARAKDPRAVPSWYIHLAYDARFYRLAASETTFAATIRLFQAGSKLLSGTDLLKTEIETIVGKALRRKIIIESLTQKGFADKRPGFRSLLSYVQGYLEADDSRLEKVSLASITTFYRIEGKMVAVVQVAVIQSEDDLPAFTDKALRLAESITGWETVALNK